MICKYDFSFSSQFWFEIYVKELFLHNFQCRSNPQPIKCWWWGFTVNLRTSWGHLASKIPRGIEQLYNWLRIRKCSMLFANSIKTLGKNDWKRWTETIKLNKLLQRVTVTGCFDILQKDTRQTVIYQIVIACVLHSCAGGREENRIWNAIIIDKFVAGKRKFIGISIYTHNVILLYPVD